MKSLDEITGMVVDAAIKIHREFGPGLLESVYEKILLAELEERGLKVECQKSLSLTYAGRTFHEAYRVDMLVEDKVILELKSTAQMAPVFPKQLRTYLVLSNFEVGLLLNFGMNTMKEGIVRVVNNYKPHVTLPSAGGTHQTTSSAASAPSAGGTRHPTSSAASAPSAGGTHHPTSSVASAPSAGGTHQTTSSAASAPSAGGTRQTTSSAASAPSAGGTRQTTSSAASAPSAGGSHPPTSSAASAPSAGGNKGEQ